jgi:hypothetical protein
LEGRVVVEVAGEIQGDVMRVRDVAHEESQRQILDAMVLVPLSRPGALGLRGNLGKAKAALSEALKREPAISSLSRMRSRNVWIGKSSALGFAG